VCCWAQPLMAALRMPQPLPTQLQHPGLLGVENCRDTARPVRASSTMLVTEALMRWHVASLEPLHAQQYSSPPSHNIQLC
jgi:hypothetical protein